MQIKLKIVRIKATQEVGTTNFKVRELHGDTEEQYPQRLAIQFTQEKTSLLDNFAPGDVVKIDINLRGREVVKEGQEPIVYNSITGWKIEKTN